MDGTGLVATLNRTVVSRGWTGSIVMLVPVVMLLWGILQRQHPVPRNVPGPG